MRVRLAVWLMNAAGILIDAAMRLDPVDMPDDARDRQIRVAINAARILDDLERAEHMDPARNGGYASDHRGMIE